MAWSRGTGNATSFTLVNTVNSTLTLVVTPGTTNSLITVFGGHSDVATVAGIADSRGNTWNSTNAKTTQAGSGAGTSWYALANNTASTAITVSWANITASFFGSVLIDVFNGNATSNPLSAIRTSSAASGVPSSTITPNDDDCLLWGASLDSITSTGPNYLKGADDANQDWSEYRGITGGSGSSMALAFLGASGAWLLHMAAFKPATTSAAAASIVQPISFLTMMGVG